MLLILREGSRTIGGQEKSGLTENQFRKALTEWNAGNFLKEVKDERGLHNCG